MTDEFWVLNKRITDVQRQINRLENRQRKATFAMVIGFFSTWAFDLLLSLCPWSW